MKIEIYVCEGCGNRVEDIYASPGWLQIDGAITRHQGRKEDRTGVTDFIAAPARHIVDAHTFCSIVCLWKRLNAIKDERELSCGHGKRNCVA